MERRQKMGHKNLDLVAEDAARAVHAAWTRKGQTTEWTPGPTRDDEKNEHP